MIIKNNINLQEQLPKTEKISYKYPKYYRILDKNIFKLLLEKRPQARHPIFNVHVSANQKINARLGLIIGKRFCKKAVMRNKIKRMIKEEFRLIAPLLQGIDILFRLKNVILIKNKQDIKFYRHNIYQIMLEIKEKNKS